MRRIPFLTHASKTPMILSGLRRNLHLDKSGLTVKQNHTQSPFLKGWAGGFSCFARLAIFIPDNTDWEYMLLNFLT
jgi:hypothetical protein